MKSLLIVIPTYNEASIIKESLLRLESFIKNNLSDVKTTIIVSDNASQDDTRAVVREVSLHTPSVQLHEIPLKGKGIAIKSAWEKFGDAYDAVMFMDADLAVDLAALPSMIALIDSHDAVIANRYHAHSSTKRSLLRRTASRIFRFLMRSVLTSNVSDFPCGCKMVKSSVALEMLPYIKNDQWFFDSELVYRLERAQKSIAQLPVTWKDRASATDSKVSVFKVGREYIREILRLRSENK
ncbi:glycosyltransferase family 2 protein [Candidatus Falkowbacteria bacterium]|nr:glycosyltransferase family 2 protein [Candidatus Falkowbacteria bacterium]